MLYFKSLGNLIVVPLVNSSTSFLNELNGDIKTKNFKFLFFEAISIAGKLPILKPITPIFSFGIPFLFKYSSAIAVCFFITFAVILSVLEPNSPYSGASTAYPFFKIFL